MGFIEDHAQSHALTRLIEQAIIAGDAQALAHELRTVSDDLVVALMDGFEPQEGIGGVYSSISLASLCTNHDRAELFVLALDVRKRALRTGRAAQGVRVLQDPRDVPRRRALSIVAAGLGLRT